MGGKHHHRRVGPPDPEALKRLRGYEAREREAALGSTRWDAEVERSLEIGLPGADSIEDKTISTFSRKELPHFAGINTFMSFPYVEDVREVGDYDAAILGAPFDMGTTYRSGTRFGPQAIRRISSLYSTYSYEFAVDLRESLKVADLGDVFRLARELRSASASTGKRFLLSVAALGIRDEALRAFTDAARNGETPGNLAVGYGVAAPALGLTVEATLHAYLYASAASLVAAGQKLIPLGGSAAQRVLYELGEEIEGAAKTSEPMEVENMYAFAPTIDVRSMMHERQRTRLYIS